MKAYEKGFGENHLQKIVFLYLDSIIRKKKKGREVLTFIDRMIRISLYGQGGIGQKFLKRKKYAQT